MASACVNMPISIYSESLLPDPIPPPKDSLVDFEFRLITDSVTTILPADKLFFNGILLPTTTTATSTSSSTPVADDVDVKSPLENPETTTDDNKPFQFSPKAPSRWRQILGLKSKKTPKVSVSVSDTCLTTPLLKDTSLESSSLSSLSISTSRLSLSSSSSSSNHDHDVDLPRFSLDDKRPRVRLRPLIDHPSTNVPTTRGAAVSMDSPRMNPAGKVVFQSLGRSSSSPSSFNGGPRYKYRGMERSYSANVRVTPVLNVPVCSLRGSSKSGGFGFGHLFSSSSSSSVRKDTNMNTNNHRRKTSN